MFRQYWRCTVLSVLLLVVACGSQKEGPPFRAEDLEIAAEMQLTTGEVPLILADVSVNGELLVSGIIPPIEGSEPSCDLWLLDPADGELRKLTEDAVLPGMHFFSAKGDRIAYTVTDRCPSDPNPETPQHIRVHTGILDLETLDKHILYGEERSIPMGRLPDGRFLVERWASEANGWTLWVVDEEGAQHMVPDLVLGSNPDFIRIAGHPSPDGSMFIHIPGLLTASEAPISLIDVESGALIGEPWEGDGFSYASGTWSPDSRFILYRAKAVSRLPTDLMMFNVARGEHRLVLEDMSGKGLAWSVSWSPDSQVILIPSRDGTALYALNTDGTGFRKVLSSTPSAPLSPLNIPRWSRDGGYLFFQRQTREETTPWGPRSEVWAAVIRKPGESDKDLEERVRQLREGPWPVSLLLMESVPR